MIEVVADAHVRGQLVADLPVVLVPRRVDLAVHAYDMLPIATL